jgi:hypothetical protein
MYCILIVSYKYNTVISILLELKSCIAVCNKIQEEDNQKEGHFCRGNRSGETWHLESEQICRSPQYKGK